jgi:hypothetical protein
MIRKYFFAAVIIYLMAPLNSVFCQSISTLESKLQEYNKQYLLEVSALDSLKSILDNRAKQIDAEKKKADYDESSIKKLMAASITISNRIDEQQKKVNNIENNLERLKRELDNKYTAVIDSLKELEKSGKYEGDKSELSERILRLTEKKILTAPKVYSLTFSPEKILTLNPAAAKTEQEKIIYNEYLDEALAEVNSKLKQVKSLSDEVSGIISLQKKTRKFLEEVEFGSEVNRSSLVLRGQGNDKTNRSSSNEYFGIDEQTSIQQVQTYFYILKQLDFKSASKVKSTELNAFDSTKKNMSLQDYSELLDEVEKRLTEYRTVLINKLGNRK